MKTKQIYYLSVIILLSIFTIKSYGQVGNPPPEPCNFTETESFCFTNNSNYNVNNYPLSPGCDYEVCVKIKPKIGCELNDHCNDIWASAIKRVAGSGTYNFRITTYAVIGE